MDSKPPRPGDACEKRDCQGRLRVYSTHINHTISRRRRYLCCDTCGHKPERNVWVVPLEYAPERH